jgi:hypothetical protein
MPVRCTGKYKNLNILMHCNGSKKANFGSKAKRDSNFASKLINLLRIILFFSTQMNMKLIWKNGSKVKKIHLGTLLSLP